MFLLLQASCVFILNTQHDVFLCTLLQKQKETNPFFTTTWVKVDQSTLLQRFVCLLKNPVNIATTTTRTTDLSNLKIQQKFDWLSILSVPDEGYSRNTSCAL